jgi:hypothetical protein
VDGPKNPEMLTHKQAWRLHGELLIQQLWPATLDAESCL